MKFVVNTNYGLDAAGRVVLEGLKLRLKKRGYDLAENDWKNYSNYDVAIFMAPDSKIREAKSKNSKLLCGIFDPKVTLYRQRKEVEVADFLVVSSIEQREFFLKYNKNVFIYYMFPDIQAKEKIHTDKEKIIISYHGNKQHLDAMGDVSWALDQISENHNIELWAIYNHKKLGKWNSNAPKKCPVKHIQWVKEEMASHLAQVDIGITPSLSPIPFLVRVLGRPLRSFILNREGYHSNDHILRFKASNNPGRMYVFSQLGIPVISDFTPSSCQMIHDNQSGLLVGTKEGWRDALERLILKKDIRNEFSRNLRNFIDNNYSIDKNFEEFLKFLKQLNVF